MSKVLSKKCIAVARYLGQLGMERLQLPQHQPCIGQCMPARITYSSTGNRTNEELAQEYEIAFRNGYP